MERFTSHGLTEEFVKENELSSKSIDVKKGVPYVRKKYVKKDMLDYGSGTYLKKFKKKEVDEEKDSVLLFDEDRYVVKEYDKYHKFRVRGYIVTDQGVIELRKRFPILIILLLLGLLLFGGYLLKGRPTVVNPPDVGNFDDWDGQYNQNPTAQVNQETITIPGFMNLICNSEHSTIKLFNYEQNTVNFVYTITREQSSTLVETFDSEYNAATYAAQHDMEIKDNLICEYILVDKSVYYTESEILYSTKQIPPGKQTTWDAYESLKSYLGENEITVRISTYDVNTGEQCYGSTQKITITVE